MDFGEYAKLDVLAGREFQWRDLPRHGCGGAPNGKGAPGTNGVGNLKHEKTVEANGAFFILFLKDRKFSFYGSAAYERRGLRSKNWPGNLDREAKRSMRYLKGISRLISEKDLFLLPPSQTAVMLTA